MALQYKTPLTNKLWSLCVLQTRDPSTNGLAFTTNSIKANVNAKQDGQQLVDTEVPGPTTEKRNAEQTLRRQPLQFPNLAAKTFKLPTEKAPTLTKRKKSLYLCSFY
jgi:hypothetical protein